MRQVPLRTQPVGQPTEAGRFEVTRGAYFFGDRLEVKMTEGNIWKSGRAESAITCRSGLPSPALIGRPSRWEGGANRAARATK